MMSFPHATRRVKRAGILAAAGAAGLFFAGACASQSEPAQEYPEPPPTTAGAEPTGEDPHAPPPDDAETRAQPTEPAQPAEPASPGEQAPAHAQADDVTDEEVTAFVSAYASIMELQVGYQDELRQVETAEEAQEIELRAQSEVTEAIEEEGLSPDRFDEIARQVQMDPELAQRVQDELGSAGLM